MNGDDDDNKGVSLIGNATKATGLTDDLELNTMIILNETIKRNRTQKFLC